METNKCRSGIILSDIYFIRIYTSIADTLTVTRENQRLFNGDDADSMELNDWWYDCKFDFQSLDANVIVEEMKSYMNKIRQVAKL